MVVLSYDVDAVWHRFSTGDVISSTDDYSLGGREAPHFAQKPARLRFLLPHFGHPLRPRGAPPRNAAAMIQTPAMDPPMHSTNIRAVIGPTSDLPSACRPGTLHRAPGHAGEVYPEPTRSAFIIQPGVLNAGKALNLFSRLQRRTPPAVVFAALKGLNMTAQGNALGTGTVTNQSPVRAK